MQAAEIGFLFFFWRLSGILLEERFEAQPGALLLYQGGLGGLDDDELFIMDVLEA